MPSAVVLPAGWLPATTLDLGGGTSYGARSTSMLFRLTRHTWAYEGDPGDESDRLVPLEPTDAEIAAFLCGRDEARHPGAVSEREAVGP